MSRIYFHSQSGEAELWGGERAWMGGLCNDLAMGVLDPFHHREQLDAMLPAEYRSPAHGECITWADRVRLHLSVGLGDRVLSWNGQDVGAFSLILNTAARLGSDAVKLAARIHGQCEIHCWAEGRDRAWLAGLIDEGLDSGVFRRNTGYAGRDENWEGVARFLRSRDDEPVVLSYSVCEQFPDPWVIGWEPPEGDEDRDAWYELPDEEKWHLGMEWLRAQAGGLQIKPDDWQTFSFGHELSALDIIASDWRERLDAAFAPAPATVARRE